MNSVLESLFGKDYEVNKNKDEDFRKKVKNNEQFYINILNKYALDDDWVRIEDENIIDDILLQMKIDTYKQMNIILEVVNRYFGWYLNGIGGRISTIGLSKK